jgi:pimeloyl-ACP methyl ester carboxylesterase
MELELADGRILEHREFGDPDGVPVIHFPGTPATAGAGALVGDAAAATGVRLIAVSRPGYGASSPSPSGLASAARDAVELMDALGLDQVSVHGSSGGGPFALALAAVAPARVGGVVVSAGVGGYLELGDLSGADAEAVDLALAGDVDGARRLLEAEAAHLFGAAAELSTAEFTSRVFPDGPPRGSFLDLNRELFEVFVTDMQRAVERWDGYVRDNLSWGGPWDIDLASVTAPVLLVYGTDDRMVPTTHGEWLHERLPSADLSLRAGGHGEITFGLATEAYEHLVGR